MLQQLFSGAGATAIAVLKVSDSGFNMGKKLSKSKKRTGAAKEIINSAVTVELNTIHLLGGLGIIKDPNHAKYLGFSDIYPCAVKEVKIYLNPA